MKRHIPNTLSGLRILLAVLLIPLVSQPIVFVVVYIAIGISDVLDGFFARRWGLESDFGAHLDSLADLLFYSIVTVIFAKLYFLDLPFSHQTLVFLIVVVRLINLALTKRRFKQIVLVHTWGNKLSGLLVYALPATLILFPNRWFVCTVLVVSLVAAVEELLITVVFDTPVPNRRSLFWV